jgi:hypothetical protein
MWVVRLKSIIEKKRKRLFLFSEIHILFFKEKMPKNIKGFGKNAMPNKKTMLSLTEMSMGARLRQVFEKDIAAAAW